ncbi:MAG TPA: ABC transporter permease [Myxococcales bacterium]|nr:ABC transporter permease [Myxococcales bacterium]
MSARRRWLALEPAGLPVLAVLLAFALCAAAILALGRSPLAAAGALLDGGLGGLEPLGESALKATALTWTGLAVALPFAAGLFNIGAQGQFLVGALAAAWAGRVLDLPAPLELPLVLGFAFALGALWALIAAELKTRRGVHEVISTILLNWIAIHLIDSWLVTGPLHASGSQGFSHSGTEVVRASAHLPLLAGAGSRLNAGLPLAAAGALAVWWLLRRTPFGLELRAIGSSEPTARAVGIPVGRRISQVMAVAGGLAALGGAMMILGGGTDFRYPENYRDPYGFDGIAIALIGAGNPFGVAAAAALFGTLRAGAVRLQDPEIGLHRSWPEIAQGVAVVLVAGQLLLRGLWRWPLRFARKPAAAGAPEASP